MKKILLKIILLLFVLYTILGLFVLPGIIKTQIEENASTVLKRTVTVDSIALNPFAFSLEIENFIIQEKESAEPFVLIRNIDVNVDPLDLIVGRIDVSLIALSSPRINIQKKADGSFNFTDLLSNDKNTSKEEKAKTELPNILIEKFAIKRGQVNFTDEAVHEPFNVKFKPINFTVRDFSTQKDHGNELSLYIEIDDGAFVKYRGKVNSLEPLQLEGALQLHSGRLYTQWRYFKDSLGFIVADGALDAEMAYTADLSANPMQININQYKLNINKLRLQDKKTKEDMLRLPSLALNGDVDVTNKHVNVAAFDIKGLSLKAIRDEQGVINWLSYLPATEEKTESNATQEPSEWKIDVKHVGIDTNEISFEEHYATTAYLGGFKAFKLRLKDMHMDDKALDINSYELAIENIYMNELEGLKAFSTPLFTLRGEAKLKQQKITLHELRLNEIKVNAFKDKEGKLNFEKYAPLVKKEEAPAEDLNKSVMNIKLNHMQMTSSTVTFKDYSAAEPFTVDIQKFQLDLNDTLLEGENLHTDKIRFSLEGLALAPISTQKTWAKFSSFKLDAKLHKTERTEVKVGNIALNGLDVYALMDEKGEINFNHLSATAPKQEKEKKPSTLDWKVKNFNINDAKIVFEDRFNAKDGLTKIDKFNLTVKDFSSDKSAYSKTKLSLRINKAGTLKLNTKLRQEPLKAISTIRLDKLDLSKFQAYVNKKANMDLNSGLLSLDIKADYSKKRTIAKADTEIYDLNLSERREGKTFFSFSKLLIKDIDFELNPDQMKIAKIDIYKPYARMKVDANKTTNLQNLMVQENNVSQESNATVTKKKPFSVFIGKVNFKDGTGNFSDLSLPLPFETDVHDLNGQMLALGTLEDITTTTDIKGTVDEYGLMMIKGKLLSSNPKKYTDMSVKFQNIDMTNLSPYTGKFIGYKLREGKMNVELDYKINDSQMLGGNRIILKKMNLGEEVESEDAISAPVGLAIALLKDGNGVIDLDVPVKGDVDAPEFAIGHVMWTAFKNIIVGVASAPFKFLGNMLGMSEDELENIGFEEGKSTLLPPEREKLDKLSTVLVEKEMLTLKVVGKYDGKRDLWAMKTAKVYAEALAKLDDNTTDISKMDRDDLDDLLKEMYVSHFKDEKLDVLEENIDKKDIEDKAKKLAVREQVIDELTQDQKIGKEDLVKLATQRSEVVVTYLITKGISADRLSTAEPENFESSKEENEYIPSQLELGAN